MDYSKKVVVIKQVEHGFNLANRSINGIARLESENGVCDLHLTVIDLAPIFDGAFWFYLIDSSGELYSLELGKRPLSYSATLIPCPNISKGFCCALVFLKDNIPTVICFGKNQDCPTDFTTLKRRIAEKCLNDFKTAQKLKELSLQKQKQEIIQEDQPCLEQEVACQPCDTEIVYDDEAVATENYFETEEKIKINLERIKEYSRERIFDENELSYCPKQTQKEQSQTYSDCPENETNFNNCQKQPNYFSGIKDHLNNIFDKFESYDKLNDIFPQSQWAKINYSKDRFYVVGLIKEMECEKYICYGVPTNNGKTPPKQLDGFCSFVALNNCSDYKGFWMMFQDAQDGKCVKSLN